MYEIYPPWWSPNCNKGGNGKKGITIHHAAGTIFDNIGATFQNRQRSTSAHWAVGPGYAQQFVDENDRAWHTGNTFGNTNTIGIETLNSTGEPNWLVDERTFDTLCELVADIAKRNGMGRLEVGRNLWGHRDFSATFCPGVLYPRLQEIADRANAINGGKAPTKTQRRKTHMECIYRPNGENYMVYYDGAKVHKLEHPDEVLAINTVYKMINGVDIPMFELGTKDAPLATRFEQAVGR